MDTFKTFIFCTKKLPNNIINQTSKSNYGRISLMFTSNFLFFAKGSCSSSSTRFTSSCCCPGLVAMIFATLDDLDATWRNLVQQTPLLN